MSTAPASNPAPVTITVKVNGLSVTMPRTTPDPITGQPVPTTMIRACEAAGVMVPHYCYHPKLPVAGNCRMCLVEYGTPALGPDRKPLTNPDGTPVINKARNPAIACATPISPGMEIYTDTPTVKAMRQGVLEFLLINHPLDCPICDQAGECKLQEYSVEYGQGASQFVEEKVHKPKQFDLGPRVMLDDERCILCSRCIRFTRDIAGDDALGFINRGSYNTLTRYPNRTFDNNYTLNTVDICPVGALTSKDFRFQMRVWFLKETPSICTSCATGCNIMIGSRENRIYRYVPRENDAVNSCWMCDQGRLNYKWIGREDRLSQVLKRSSANGAKHIIWHSAVEEIAHALRAALPGSTAIIASARQSNEELFLLSRLARKLSTLNDSLPRNGEGDKLLVNADKNPNMNGVQLMGLAPKVPGSNIEAIKKGIQAGTIKILIVAGEDITPLIEPAVLKNLKTLVVTDILPNATTALAHYLLPGCAHAEKRGTFININGRLQKFLKAVDPPGEARPETDFLRDIVQRVTGESLPPDIEGLFNTMAREVPALNGITWASVGETGVNVTLQA
jgi:NADH-quinone oxidoreductase subunit G